MDTLIQQSYLLSKDPFEINFIDAERTVLSLSTSLRIINMQSKEGRLRIETEQAALEITQASRRFMLNWQGAGIENRFKLEGRWFGIGELVNQPWSLNEITMPAHDLLTSDAGATGYSNLMSPVWMNEHGVLIIAHSPVKMGINQMPDAPTEFPEYVFGEEIPFDQRPVFDEKGLGDGNLTLIGDNLQLDIYVTGDILQAQRKLVEVLGHPKKTPPLELFGEPVWTTWAQYKDLINQEKVLDFARQIKANDFPHLVMEIDDRWQKMYGDLAFDTERFPDARGMVDELHEMGFKVTAWVIPFLHRQSEAGKEAAQFGYAVKTPTGEPYVVRWWQGKGYLIDPTNPAAMEWFGKRLKKLQDEVGLDGYKFDGGEAMYVPKDGVLHRPGNSRNQYSHAYVDWISKNYSFCEVRTGWMNQEAPILFRLWDLWSTWGKDNGLAAVVPATLLLSMTGYPFTFPDMIGGNGYFTFPKNKVLNNLITKVIIPMMERQKQAATEDEDVGVMASDVPPAIQKMAMFGWPTKELMIRWTQLNALMPVMQFSIVPWQFGEECARICREFTNLHLELVPLFEKLANDVAATGEPIIRPVFWLAPNDPKALSCDDQFLIGNEILVAPVVEKGQRARDIYLPPGVWLDHWTGKVFEGPQVLKQYPAPLEQIPFFHVKG